ncbi:MAG: putative aldouronate transport system substrate-binding protein [Streptomyces sp.]|jgi:putative aldouronate transport system substrate-binding protein|nr:putative aldouronate transport system substrate-binding protein [Streptomyces sp.]
MGAHLTRRNVLLAGLATAALPVLAACGDGAVEVSLSDNADVRLPDYVPFRDVRPDLLGTKAGVLNGYYHYPKHPLAAAPDGPPAEGPSIDVMTLTYSPVPPPVSKNPMWRKLNKSLGTDLNYEIVPVSNYPVKFPLTVAGGDLPDAMLVLPSAPRQPAMLNALFEDLSPYLSGSGVRRYPYLANIPSSSWGPLVIAGGLYGLPMPRANSGSAMFYRADIMKQKGLDPDPKSFKDFLQLCKDVSDPKHAKYANGDPTVTLDFVLEMLRGANNWRENNGRFTWWLEESDILHQALDAMRQLVKAETFHPDGFTTVGKFKDWFGNGQIAINYDGLSAWNQYLVQYGATDPKLDIDAMVAPGFDGGAGSHWAGHTNFAMLSLKKAPRERIEQLLRAFNLLASPFGTDHYLLRKYGVDGHDFEYKGTDPMLTPIGTQDTGLPTTFTTDAPQSIYYPQGTEPVRRQYEFQKRAVDILVTDPSYGLYSETNTTLGNTLQQDIIEGPLKGYMRGNAGWSDIQDAVAHWRRGGGDKMRDEFEKYWASLHT